jgi:hypothetical protein
MEGFALPERHSLILHEVLLSTFLSIVVFGEAIAGRRMRPGFRVERLSESMDRLQVSTEKYRDPAAAVAPIFGVK